MTGTLTSESARIGPPHVAAGRTDRADDNNAAALHQAIAARNTISPGLAKEDSVKS